MEGDGVAELRDAHPAWEITHNGSEVSAWWLGSSPPIRLTAPTVTKLAEVIVAAEAAWERTHSYWKVIEAASKAVGP
jgi:hypothetical protein